MTLDGSLPERCEAASPSDDRLLLTRLLQSLPQRERQVVVLRHYVDLSEREVADLLGVSIGTVKSSASRGLATLRAELALQQKEMTR